MGEQINFVFSQSKSDMSHKIGATDLGDALATYLEEHYFKGD